MAVPCALFIEYSLFTLIKQDSHYLDPDQSNATPNRILGEIRQILKDRLAIQPCQGHCRYPENLKRRTRARGGVDTPGKPGETDYTEQR
jgi:hypothetical protein